MAELQTIDEMRAAYDGEWVIIVDCEHDERGRLVRGRVVAHSRSKREVHKRMLDLPRGTSGATRYLGEVPADLHFAL